LKRRRKQIDAQYEELRHRILDRREQGGQIEPGPFRVDFRESEIQQPTFSKLEELYGEEFVLKLRSQLPVRKQVAVIISAPRGEHDLDPGAEAMGEPGETSGPGEYW